MGRRSDAQKKIDDRAWPVRVLVYVPTGGFGSAMNPLYDWLNQTLGREGYTVHSAPRFGTRDTKAFYFRSSEDLLRFIEAHPFLELADGTKEQIYTSPALPFGRG